MFLRQSSSQLIEIGPFLDIGDGVTEEEGLTIANTDIRLSKDGAVWVNKNSGGATHREDGWYDLTLDATDTATVGELVLKVQIPATALPVWVRYQVLEEAVYDSLYESGATGPLQATTAGRTLDIAATGEVALGFGATIGTIDAAQIGAAALTAAKFGADFITAASIADNSIGADQLATDAIGDAQIATGAIASTAFAAGAIDAAAIANGAIDAATFAAGAIDAAAINADASGKIIGALIGTATSGTTTTIIDTVNLTQADTDYWKGSVVTITSGNIAGQTRRVASFDPGADEITVDTAFTQAVGTNGFIIVRTAYAEASAGGTDWTSGERDNIRDALGVDGAKTTATGGQLQGTLTANPAAAGIASGSFAAGAIDNNAFNVTETLTANPASGGIVAGSFGAGAINAAALATDAVDEIADGVWNEDAGAHQTLGTFGQAIGDPVANAKTLYQALVEDAVGASVTADVATLQSDTDDIQARLPAVLVGGAMDCDVSVIQAGAIDAAAIATDAIDADAIASDAVTELRSIKTGTATSGSTTTLIDTVNLTEADTNYWRGAWLLITSGSTIGQVRLITAFTAGSNLLTVSPAFTQAITTNTFEILPTGALDLGMWRQAVPLDLDTSRVVVQVAVMEADVLDAAAIATDAIGADELATTAVEEIARALLPQVNTAFSNITFEMYDDTNHNPTAGLTVTGERSLNGGAYASVSGSINQISDGTYQFDALAADMNGALIVFKFTASGADDTFVHIKTAS